MKSVFRLSSFSLLLLASVASPQAQSPSVIKRFDGSTITTAEAALFAKATLEREHVTGAQIAIVQGERLVWSAAFGLLQTKAKGGKPHLSDLPMVSAGGCSRGRASALPSSRKAMAMARRTT